MVTFATFSEHSPQKEIDTNIHYLPKMCHMYGYVFLSKQPFWKMTVDSVNSYVKITEVYRKNTGLTGACV